MSLSLEEVVAECMPISRVGQAMNMRAREQHECHEAGGSAERCETADSHEAHTFSILDE